MILAEQQEAVTTFALEMRTMLRTPGVFRFQNQNVPSKPACFFSWIPLQKLIDVGKNTLCGTE